MDPRTESAAEALDQIRTGGGHLLLTCNQRIGDVQRNLDTGQFTAALESAQQLVAKLASLAQAQTAMGLLAHHTLLKVSELSDGMIFPGVGAISDVGPCPNCGREECPHISFVVDGQTMILDRDLEVVVEKVE